ncbi:Uncharacterized WD repeat-containing protein alr3466 [Durusdinium trenchii]|uniref:Uncharacterized WD repeat-containing protein alr3466 n=1 Tax=Durusdinium trenchii TaxID=1381693 RepID=A0ABP0SDS3_9DINO
MAAEKYSSRSVWLSGMAATASDWLRRGGRRSSSKTPRDLPRGWVDQEEELTALVDATFPDRAELPGGEDWPCVEEQAERRQRSDVVVERVLRGRAWLPEDLVQEKAKVRFFVSSTFTDTKLERDLFYAVCAPYLRDVCRAKGLEFEMSEMRWGINNGLSQSHKTSALCMTELDRCVNESAAVQFVGILGNKYGYRPFPAEIEVGLFEELLKRVKDDDERGLLNKWFVHDDNHGVFALSPVTTHIPKYNPEVQDEHAKEWWGQCFEPMQATLRAAAVQLADEIGDPEVALPFLQSVTEDEMRRGFQAGNAVLIVRELAGDIDSPAYVDLGDEEALERLKELKSEMRELVGEVMDFEVPWKLGGVDPVKHQEHAAYLKDVLTRWTIAVEKSIASVARFEQDPVFEEAQAHLGFAHDKAKMFVGREDLVHGVVDAVSAGKSTIVFGESGAGKTSVLAKAVLGAPEDCNVIVRFLGTTTGSRDRVQLLKSLCGQLVRIYPAQGDDTAEPTDWNKLIGFFPELLARATPEEPLLLVLDSLDQLDNAENDRFNWLPSKLPEHVTLLVSSLPESYLANILPALRTKVAFEEEIQVPALQATDVPDILGSWLTSRNSQLSRAQAAAVQGVVERVDNPTYLLLRVLFNEALVWRGNTAVPQAWTEINDVRSAIEVLFARIEAEHGDCLVRQALGFLTCARDGLTQNELEDLLSSDDSVLKECFQWWVPPVARVPPLQVTRLLDALADYLVSDTHAWFHRQFREVAFRRYVSDGKKDLCNVVANYFAGSMESRKHDLAGAHKVRLAGNRLMAPQPAFLDHDLKVANVRKVRELIFAFVGAERHQDALRELKEPLLLRAYWAAGLERELLDLLQDSALPEPRFRALLYQAVMLSRNQLEKSGAFILAEQLWGRLSRVMDDPVFLKMLDKRRREWAPWVCVSETVLAQAGDALVTSFEGHTGRVSKVVTVKLVDGRHMVVSGSFDRTVRLWDPVSGTCEATLEGHTRVVNTVATLELSDGRQMVVSGSSDKTVRLWDPVSGICAATLEGHIGSVQTVATVELSDGRQMLVSGSHDNTVRLWDPISGTCEAILEGHTGGVRTVSAVKLNGGRQMAVSGSSDRTVRLWNPESGTCEMTLKGHADEVRTVTSVELKGGRQMVVSGSDDHTLRLWDPVSGTCEETLTGHTGRVNTVATVKLDGGRRVLVSGSHDNTVRVWDLDSRTCEAKLEGHTAEVCTVVAVALNDGRPMVVSGSSDKAVRLWDPVSGTCKAILEGHTAEVCTVVAVALGDGRQVLVSGSHDNTVRLWDPVSGTFVATPDGHTESVNTCAPVELGDGRQMVVSGSDDHTVRLWDPVSRTCEATLDGHTGEVCTVVAVELSDGRQMVASGSGDHTVRLWDLARVEGHTGQVNTVITAELSDVLPMVVLGSSSGTLRLWDPASGSWGAKLEGHTASVDTVTTMELCDGRQMLVSGSYDHTVRLWDPVSGTCEATLEGHTGAVFSVASVVLSDGRQMVVSGSSDNTVRLWHSAS